MTRLVAVTSICKCNVSPGPSTSDVIWNRIINARAYCIHPAQRSAGCTDSNAIPETDGWGTLNVGRDLIKEETNCSISRDMDVVLDRWGEEGAEPSWSTEIVDTSSQKVSGLRRPWGWPRTRWREYISHLVWETANRVVVLRRHASTCLVEVNPVF